MSYIIIKLNYLYFNLLAYSSSIYILYIYVCVCVFV